MTEVRPQLKSAPAGLVRRGVHVGLLKVRPCGAC